MPENHSLSTTQFEQHASPYRGGELLLGSGATVLSRYGVIRVRGEDTLIFLNNLLTQDFLHIPEQEARFCSFCNAKGRIQASFYAVKTAQNEVLLICDVDLIAQTVKKLSLYVLRSKVRLDNASSDFSVYGVIDSFGSQNPDCPIQAASSSLTPTFNDTPWKYELLSLPGESVLHWISLYPALGKSRALCIAPNKLGGSPPFEMTSILSESHWECSEILSGVCLTNLETFEAFVPQMINYESVGGVHFQKGCYPGQEIVARSQYRGTIKRRGFLLSSDHALLAGQSLFVDNELQNPASQVLRACELGGKYYSFASLLLSALDGSTRSPSALHPASLNLFTQDSQNRILPVHIQVSLPPYPLRDDI